MKKLRNIAIAALAIMLIASVIGYAETFRQGGDRFSFNPTATVTKTADYTLTTSDSYVKFTASTAALTATLPSLATVRASYGSKTYKILKTDALPLAITITPATGETIGGESYRKLYYQNAYIVISAGPNSDWTVAYESPYTVEDYEAGTVDLYSLSRIPNLVTTSLTGSTTLTNAYSGKVILNASGTRNIHVLPLASTVPGATFTFVTGSTGTFGINPNDADSIIPTTDTAGDSLISPAVAGASVSLYSVGSTSWIVTSMTPTFGINASSWTDGN